MKGTQAKSSTASKSSAITQKVSTPVQPKQNPMPSNPASIIPTTTFESGNIVVNCPSKSVVRSQINECIPPKPGFVASESHRTTEGLNVSDPTNLASPLLPEIVQSPV
jgi:hypothetical protein